MKCLALAGLNEGSRWAELAEVLARNALGVGRILPRRRVAGAGLYRIAQALGLGLSPRDHRKVARYEVPGIGPKQTPSRRERYD